MKKNVGRGDRILRVILGIAIMAAGIYYQSWWGAIAILPLFTAVINWCPLYVAFNLSTRKAE